MRYDAHIFSERTARDSIFFLTYKNYFLELIRENGLLVGIFELICIVVNRCLSSSVIMLICEHLTKLKKLHMAINVNLEGFKHKIKLIIS